SLLRTTQTWSRSTTPSLIKDESDSSRRRCRTTLVIAEAHSLVLLPSVRSSFWSHRQELYPHTTACFCCASVGMIVHFISPQDKGMGRHLDIRSEDHTSELQSRVDLVCRL